MSATNHTTNYELPIFVGSDKPAWLVDWNGAMTAIDTAIHTAEGKADQAGTDIGGIESSISTINSTLTSINNAVSQLRLDTNANTGSINTITELIGNGTPTTTDKTIIGAINEINANVVSSGADVNASSVYTSAEKVIGKWLGATLYQKVLTGTVTLSGLTTTSVTDSDIANVHPVSITGYMRRVSDGFQICISASNAGAGTPPYTFASYTPGTGVSLISRISDDAYEYAVIVTYTK